MTDNALREVTAEQFAAIRADLEKLLKLQQKPKEALADYALRLAKAATDPKTTADDDWETLDETTQNWVNGVIDADEKGTPLPLPPAEAVVAPEGGAEGSKEEENVSKPATKSKPAPAKAAKAPPAKAPAKKPTASARPGRKPKHADDEIVTVVGTENPHRKGSNDFDKFKKLKAKDGQTVAKVMAAGVEVSYLRYAEKRGIVTIKKPAKKAA